MVVGVAKETSIFHGGIFFAVMDKNSKIWLNFVHAKINNFCYGKIVEFREFFNRFCPSNEKMNVLWTMDRLSIGDTA